MSLLISHRARYDQFTDGETRPLTQDLNGFVIDTEKQLPPHLCFPRWGKPRSASSRCDACPKAQCSGLHVSCTLVSKPDRVGPSYKQLPCRGGCKVEGGCSPVRKISLHGSDKLSDYMGEPYPPAYQTAWHSGRLWQLPIAEAQANLDGSPHTDVPPAVHQFPPVISAAAWAAQVICLLISQISSLWPPPLARETPLLLIYHNR